MSAPLVGMRLCSDGVTRAVYADRRGEYVIIDGERRRISGRVVS